MQPSPNSSASSRTWYCQAFVLVYFCFLRLWCVYSSISLWLNLHFLMTNSVSHLFRGLFAIHIPSLKCLFAIHIPYLKWLFKAFPHFLIGLSFFYYWIYVYSLWCLYVYPKHKDLKDLWFTNIFYQSAACAFFSLLVLFR